MPLESRAGWVLAGGRSSRMGADKALLEIDGSPLMARVAEVARVVCGKVTLVGDPARYAGLGYPVVADSFAGAGPLAGIEAALAATQAEWNLILACDMPAMEAGFLESLFAAAEAPFAAVLPVHPDGPTKGKAEPLCAVYGRACHGAIRAALERGVRKITDGLEGLAVRYVPVPDSGLVLNLNTPHDLRTYQSQRHRNG